MRKKANKKWRKKMKFRGRFVLVVTVITLAFGMLPLSVMAETDGELSVSGNALEFYTEMTSESGLETITGFCGDLSENEGKNVTYTITDSDGDGTYDLLNIDGVGRMRNYSRFDDNRPPWVFRSIQDKICIRRAIIGDGVTCVGSFAFRGCILKEVTLSEGVMTIGEGAFEDCDSLKEVIIPEGVTTIGEGAFGYCDSLREVTIPKGVTTIGEGAFESCNSLKEVTIPEGVTTIGRCAFQDCSSLREVTIPEGVTTIEYATFWGCGSLEEVTMPEGLITIGIDAFIYCSSLREVTISEGVMTIGTGAFIGCDSLSKVTLSEGVMTIGQYAFSDCSSLKEMIIPQGVTTIESGDFSVTPRNVILLDSITSIGDGGIRLQTMFIYDDEMPQTIKVMGSYPTSIVRFTIDGNPWSVAEGGITILQIDLGSTVPVEIPDTLSNRPVTFVAKEYRHLVSEEGHTHRYAEDGFCSICDKEYAFADTNIIPTGPDTWRDKTGIEGFVYRLYNVALIRDAEDAGLADWMNRLDTKKESAAEVARGFFFSDEFLDRNYTNEQYVEFLYRTMFGRDSDEGGKAYWLKCLENGASREYVYHGFAESQEFTGLCEDFGVDRGSVSLGQYRDQNIEATGFVARLYTKMLGRNFDDDGIEYWCEEYVTGKKSIEDIAADGFLHSPEFTGQNLSDKEFVTRMYETFLNREPDEAGLNDWVGRLKREEITRDSLVYGFTNSSEFEKLKAEYNLP